MAPAAQLQSVKPRTITPKMSLGVTQNLIRALFSELCFARNIFGSESFAQQQFGQQRYHALVRDSGDDDVEKVLSWVEDGAFAALKDGHLAMILFGIYTDAQDPTKLIEAWYFRVTGDGQLEVSRGKDNEHAGDNNNPSWVNGFNKGSALMGVNTEEVTKLSSNFVRTVVALNSALDDLPKVGTQCFANFVLCGASCSIPNVSGRKTRGFFSIATVALPPSTAAYFFEISEITSSYCAKFCLAMPRNAT
jgi:hypothetical protein